MKPIYVLQDGRDFYVSTVSDDAVKLDAVKVTLPAKGRFGETPENGMAWRQDFAKWCEATAIKPVFI